jgi:AmmeMemoRadiSam system protein B
MTARNRALRIRPPAVAGTFYPAGRKQLETTVRDLLAEARAPAAAGLLGVIAPHAGYMYSGPVAGSAFATLAASAAAFDRVLLLGPPHYLPVSGIAAPSAEAFATPLGEVAIDREAIAALADAGRVGVDDRPHAPEHCLEVELPFLQTVLGGFTLIPLLVGDAAPRQVAAVIDAVLNRGTLLVVSTDLSHYLDYDAAKARDRVTAETIERRECDRLGAYDACGYAALNGALCAARAKNWRIARLDLRNSGDISGDRARVVGYGAWTLSAAG